MTMKPELQNQLYAKYPAIFRDKDLPMSQTCMCWGIETGDGYYGVLDHLCYALSNMFSTGFYVGDEFVSVEPPQVVADQVKEKYGCYDKETEVLTREGWKYFQQVTFDDEIATLTSDNELIYQRPTDIISYSYVGSMYRLVARGVDLLVTPNHNLYVAKGNSFGRFPEGNTRKHPFNFLTPDKLFRHPKRFLKTAIWKGSELETFMVPALSWGHKIHPNGKIKKQLPYSRQYKKFERSYKTDTFLELLGIIISEGCIGKKTPQIAIAACNDGTVKADEEQRNWEKIISGNGYPINKTHEDNSAICYQIYDTRLAHWLRKEVGCGASNKRVPSFIKELTPRQIIIFLKALYQGDGHKTKTSHTLTTTSLALSNDVQELLLKAGFSFRHDVLPPKSGQINGKRIEGKHPVHTINWLKLPDFNIETKTTRGKQYVEEWQPYNGSVYCLTVPNHTLFVRRNGKGVWCGNSLRFYYHLEFPDSFREQVKMYPDAKEIANRYSEYIDGIVHMAESMSERTCEETGLPGQLHVTGNRHGWYKTLNREFAKTDPFCVSRNYVPVADLPKEPDEVQ